MPDPGSTMVRLYDHHRSVPSPSALAVVALAASPRPSAQIRVPTSQPRGGRRPHAHARGGHKRRRRVRSGERGRPNSDRGGEEVRGTRRRPRHRPAEDRSSRGQMPKPPVSNTSWSSANRTCSPPTSRQATVVTLYLLSSANAQLRPVITRQLRPGTRIVSHAFSMGPTWPADTSRPIHRPRPATRSRSICGSSTGSSGREARIEQLPSASSQSRAESGLVTADVSRDHCALRPVARQRQVDDLFRPAACRCGRPCARPWRTPLSRPARGSGSLRSPRPGRPAAAACRCGRSRAAPAPDRRRRAVVCSSDDGLFRADLRRTADLVSR